jgi:hypothetical protein
MGTAFPGEAAEYRAVRNRLEREIELRRLMEAVAAARRQLPPGGVVAEDYIFQGAGANAVATDVRLSASETWPPVHARTATWWSDPLSGRHTIPTPPSAPRFAWHARP